jgi:biopolymer transport protein TolR
MGMGPIKKEGKRGLMTDINVTPFVDVMLVLLIIFMVTAPMMTQGVDVDLPETTQVPLRQKDEPIIVSINEKGAIFLNNIEGDRILLKQQLGNLARTSKDQTIFLRADRKVPYGLVVAVMADIKEVGFDKLGMITRPADEK